MNERECPCADHATARADGNRGCKIRARYPPVFRPEEGYVFGITKPRRGRHLDLSLEPAALVMTDNGRVTQAERRLTELSKRLA